MKQLLTIEDKIEILDQILVKLTVRTLDEKFGSGYICTAYIKVVYKYDTSTEGYTTHMRRVFPELYNNLNAITKRHFRKLSEDLSPVLFTNYIDRKNFLLHLRNNLVKQINNDSMY